LGRRSSRLQKGQAATAALIAGKLLGLFASEPTAWFQAGAALDSRAIEAAIAARLAARKAKNWAEADRIRDELKAQGIILEDGAGGTGWKRA
jgi:cysteinyl-tRNA synthetase